jgi:hypothetical protein
MMNVQLQGTAAQIRAEMREFLGLDREDGKGETQPATETKPAGRGRGKASTTSSADAGASTEQSSAAGSAEGNSSVPAGGTATTTAAAGSDASAPSRDDIAKLCTSYGQKAGTPALQQLFREHGAENGKWSEVGDDKLPALKVRLDELLAG